ncbi:NAD(P)-dependent oxidoreductase [Arthrobacter dokdonensis]|uniref:NAD(P)-dependent oxidoreductase n=1 Tax=Arthrobacter dokdonellae TaxID=2211210 RepID=UPI000DE58A18|nr:NAD(P)-dependent oxidoreductase [Arthrobacter dokdonellae]
MNLPATDISVIGLGPMGHPIARRLVESYGAITVWNRTAAVAADFLTWGANVAPTVAEAARPVVVTVLPDLPQVQALTGALREGWAARGITEPILIVHGTVSPVAVADFAEQLRDEGIRVIDAPVSGGTIGAAEGRLSIMVGGDARAAATLEPIFARYGTTVRYLGPSGSGALAKMCNQIVVAATVSALAEASILARHGGLDLPVVFDLLGGGLANSEVLQQKRTRLLENDFAGGGSADNQLKDLRYIAESAENLGLHLPVSEAVAALYQRMIDEGQGADDHSGVIRTLENLAETP